jgi:hypothetical protein
VEKKSIWKSTIFILFFFQKPKSFLQEKRVLHKILILFNQATEHQNHFCAQMKSLDEDGKTFFVF